jgi:hypothetical protein
MSLLRLRKPTLSLLVLVARQAYMTRRPLEALEVIVVLGILSVMAAAVQEPTTHGPELPQPTPVVEDQAVGLPHPVTQRTAALPFTAGLRATMEPLQPKVAAVAEQADQALHLELEAPE